MYTILEHGRMLADRARTAAYAEALRRVVTADSVVVDVGTGTGLFALLACRHGARRVFAIEPADVIGVARDIAAVNGYADRIEFIQSLSTDVTLPELADVIVCDVRGVLPGRQAPVMLDARRRLLKPGGVLIPQRDTLWAVVVEAPTLHDGYLAPWNDAGYRFDMQPARRLATNLWRKAQVGPEQLLTAPRCWATLDYVTAERPEIGAEVTWTARRAGTGHGLIVWFDSLLADGVSLSNAPGMPALLYGSGFFPWPEPVSLAVGDAVSVVLRADPLGDDCVWRWDSRVCSPGEPGRHKAAFAQSTFFAVPLVADRLRKRAAGYVPALGEDGRIDRLILGLMDERIPLDEIARRVASQFPGRFATWQDALARVGELSQRYASD